jgi:hypothetical protein
MDSNCIISFEQVDGKVVGYNRASLQKKIKKAEEIIAHINKDILYHHLKLVVDTLWSIPAALDASYFIYLHILHCPIPSKQSLIPHSVGC